MQESVDGGKHALQLPDENRFRLIHGDCLTHLSKLPSKSVNCVITSPPYWQQREYDVEECMEKYMVGVEQTPEEYVDRLRRIFYEVKRVLTQDGSLWLNIGDKYVNKDLVGLPWMVALALKKDGWILRNDIIWNKMKGTQSSKDRLHAIHEYLFHFVKSKSYYYDRKPILIKPAKKPRVTNGRIQSATGVSGVRYRQKIAESESLTQSEKREAIVALDRVLEEMKEGKLVDFRMTIRGGQRVYHGSKASKSGRSRELENKGYFVIKMGAAGYMPNTIWNIVPEDEWRRDDHCAVFPTALLEIPIMATCPQDGIVLDPFMGTGSAVVAAVSMGRKGLGMEISENYVMTAESRLALLSYDGRAANPAA